MAQARNIQESRKVERALRVADLRDGRRLNKAKTFRSPRDYDKRARKINRQDGW